MDKVRVTEIASHHRCDFNLRLGILMERDVIGWDARNSAARLHLQRYVSRGDRLYV